MLPVRDKQHRTREDMATQPTDAGWLSFATSFFKMLFDAKDSFSDWRKQTSVFASSAAGS